MIYQVFAANLLVSIILNEAISACRFLKVEGFCMRASTVFGVIILVLIITNEAVSGCGLLKVDGSFIRVLLYAFDLNLHLQF